MALLTTVKKWMEQDGLNPTYLEEAFSSYYANKKIDPENRREFGFNFLTGKRYDSIVRMCSEFSPYFSMDEFSKLVSRVLASYSYIHAAYLSTNDKHDELNVRMSATPCKPLPFLEVSCSKECIVKKSTIPGHPPRPIHF